LFLPVEKNTTVYDTGLHFKQIEADGVQRRYAVYIPSDIENRSVPLVFELHGGGVYIEDMTGQR
jgi:poly(3-hydroxybutyrate) depolymerase